MKVRDKVFDYESNSVVTVIGFGEKDGRNVIDIPTRIWNFPRRRRIKMALPESTR